MGKRKRSGARRSKQGNSPKQTVAVALAPGTLAAKVDWGKANFWLAAAAIAVSVVVAIGVGYWGLRASGAFDKSDISLNFEQDALPQNKIAQVFVAVNTTFNSEDKILIPIRLRVQNAGKKVLSNVRLTLQYATKARVQDVDVDQYMENHGALMPDDDKEETNINSDDGQVYTNFKFASLNIDQSRSIEYAVQAYEPDFRAEKVMLSVRQVAMKVLLEADGVPRKTFQLNYNVVPADGFNELVGSYSRLYGRFGKTVLGQNNYTDYLVSAEYRAASTPSGRVWVPLGSLKEAKAIVQASDK